MEELLDRKQSQREHKKRMKAAQADRRNLELSELVRKLCLNIPHLQTPLMTKAREQGQSELLQLVENELPELFIPVSVEFGETSFWTDVPACLTPDRATLDSSITTQSVLKGEEARQRKFRKKLEQKVRCGEITIEEMETKLETFGRPGIEERGGEQTEGGHAFSLLNCNRGLRKRQQVESIAAVLQRTAIAPRSLVVDFGCGSGNLCLSLAAKNPSTTFLLVDRNIHSLNLVEARAKAGGLSNVVVKQFAFDWKNLAVFCSEVEKEHGMLWDLGIGLHCCGAFTDMVLDVCLKAGSDCLVVPCCNGKMHQGAVQGTVNQEAVQGPVQGVEQEQEQEGFHQEISYPRSQLYTRLVTADQYWSLSRAADDENHYLAKCLIEYDRAHHHIETGRQVSLLKMSPPTATPKHHILYSTTMETKT